jgi:hypothetical protein
MTGEKFKTYFNFDDVDLRSNRNGSLSPKQKARLGQHDQSVRIRFRIAGFILAACAVLPVLVLLFANKLSYFGWYILFWAAPCCVVAFFLIRTGFKSTTYTLKKAQGPATLLKGITDNNPASPYYELRIGGKAFCIGSKLVSYLTSGDVYAIYYYWGSNTVESDLDDSYILSVEAFPKRD